MNEMLCNIIKSGKSYSKRIVVSENDVKAFAEVSKDFNPIHLDEKVAEKSIFKKKVVHGMLIGAYISGILGMEFPGNGTIYLSQELKFVKPIFVEEMIEIYIEVESVKENGIAEMTTNVYDIEKNMLVQGHAVVKI